MIHVKERQNQYIEILEKREINEDIIYEIEIQVTSLALLLESDNF
jgi:hypothetical protein